MSEPERRRANDHRLYQVLTFIYRLATAALLQMDETARNHLCGKSAAIPTDLLPKHH